MEGTTSYGAGLCSYLMERGYDVFEVLRPKREKRRVGEGKTDGIDAEHAARAVAAGKGIVPKSHNEWVEGLRALTVARSIHVNTMTSVSNAIGSLLVSAPERVRTKYRPLKGASLYRKLGSCRPNAEDDVAGPLLASLRALARTWLELDEKAGQLEGAMHRLIEANAPALLQVKGCGTVNAAELAIAAGDNPERIPSEASFASICGVSPIPASSGKTDRHRLNRGGNRQANKALHMIAVSRMSGDERTLAYMAKRKSDGKKKREAMRCLKRFIAREVYSTLRHPMRLKYARGEELAAMRKSLGLTQQQIARELNVPNVRLSEIERDVCPHEEIRREYDRYLNAKMSANKGLDSP